MGAELLSASPISSASIGNGSLEQLVVHWAKARMDEPLALIDRYDNAARQLISLGGLLQGAYVGIFAVSHINASAQAGYVAALFGLLVLVVFAAAWSICKFPSELNAFKAFHLVHFATASEDVGAAVEDEIKCWCQSVDRLARKKHIWLRISTFSLLGSFVAAALLLVRLMNT